MLSDIDTEQIGQKTIVVTYYCPIIVKVSSDYRTKLRSDDGLSYRYQ